MKKQKLLFPPQRLCYGHYYMSALVSSPSRQAAIYSIRVDVCEAIRDWIGRQVKGTITSNLKIWCFPPANNSIPSGKPLADNYLRGCVCRNQDDVEGGSEVPMHKVNKAQSVVKGSLTPMELSSKKSFAPPVLVITCNLINNSNR